MVTVLVVVPLNSNVPSIVAIPPMLQVVTVVPKSSVPDETERLFNLLEVELSLSDLEEVNYDRICREIKEKITKIKKY